MSDGGLRSLTSPTASGPARSDHSLPSIWLVGVLASTVFLALAFVGYRIVEIESYRRTVNQQIEFLAGKEQVLTEARDRRIELSQLQHQVGSAKATLGGLQESTSSLRSEAEALESRIRAKEEQLAGIQSESAREANRVQELGAEGSRLEARLEQLRASAAQADASSERARTARDRLQREVAPLAGCGKLPSAGADRAV